MSASGDEYYWFGFHFLFFATDSLKVDAKGFLGLDISEDTAKSLTSQFMNKFEFGERGYLANSFELYFVHLLVSLREWRIENKSKFKKIFLIVLKNIVIMG
jgi:hypothetical protein